MKINSDHNVIFAPYIAADYADTLDTLFWGDKAQVNGLDLNPILMFFANISFDSLCRRVG